ncbi:MAG: metallophosphoesterase, partial [Eubacteriales bacterium]
QNIVSVKPSLLMDLGDTFMAEKNGVSTQQQVNKRYTEARGYFDLLGSIPLYLVTGNHEGENGWEPEIQTMARAARLQYFPADTTLSGYSGDTQTANYYTFLQGGAQFMVLDPFTFSAQRAKGDTDGWNYTLGKTQYDWLKNVLKNSKAKYKFVFIHNLVGGLSKDERGGAEEAKYYEWGGYSPDGNYDFDKMRPGWGEPIQQLFVENYVTAVFHGHDHFYAHQSLDGIAYQLVPQPGTPGNSVGDAPKFGYKDGVILPSAGFLRVTVSGSGVKVEYLKSSLQSKDNMSIGDSYTINLS